MAGTNDVRGALHRRFTTNTVPQLSPIGQQRRQAAGDVQQPVSAIFLNAGQASGAASRARDKNKDMRYSHMEESRAQRVGSHMTVICHHG